MRISKYLFILAVSALSRNGLLVSLVLFFFSALAYGAFQIPINGPSGSGAFGSQVTILANGNLVIVDPGYDTPGPIPDVGAAFLYNGATGDLISTLTGSSTGDFAGTRIVALPNSDYVVINQFWDNGAVANVGAATHCDGVTGCNWPISPANSLVGTTAEDRVGSNSTEPVVILANGNYLIVSPQWDNGTIDRAGAVTWVNGETGITGPVTPANSLVGSAANEQLGSPAPVPLPNGNYVVTDTSWNGSRGSVTIGNGTGGTVGPVTEANSLVGIFAGDSVGGRIVVLANSNVVVSSQSWNSQRGAVTLCFGDGSTVGEVSAANSMVGSNPNDAVGSNAAITLTNGNYVFRSVFWNGERGAVTWGSGTKPTVGVVSDSNSLIGSAPGDHIGSRGIFALANGNYVVNSDEWDNGPVPNAGAVTWGNGATGTFGTVSAANSLVGSMENDQVGGRDTVALTNGNYVVRAPFWDNGPAVDAGAVAWGNGNGGPVGPISAANALVGTSTNDQVGTSSEGAIVALANGNYAVPSPGWDDTANSLIDAGAVTWGNGSSGTSGTISLSNSIIGAAADDRIGSGSIYPLANGNFVFASPFWDNGAIANVGAVTFVNGAAGLTGNVNAANSLIGDTTGLMLGTTDTFALTNGNYVVRSTRWNNFTGAVAFGNGTTGTTGVIGPANSLVGSNPDDHIGGSAIFVLPNGNYLVSSNSWGGNRGAVTWGNGTTGTIAVVSPANSLTGGVSGDFVGPNQLITGPDGNYVVVTEAVGGFSFGAANGPTAGNIGNSNTVFRSAPDTFPPISKAQVNSVLGNMVVALPLENRVVIFNPTYAAVADGNWSNGLTWDYGEIRTRVDTRIPTGRTVTLDSDVISNLVTVEEAAFLNVVGPRSSISNIGIEGTIDISQGLLNMQANILSIDCDGLLLGAGPANYVIGLTRKFFCSPGSFRFPTGTSNGFSPLDVNVTATDVSSSLSVSAAQTAHPALVPGASLKRYWTLTEVGSITADLTFNYLDPTDISNFESTYKLFRISGGIPELAAPFVLDPEANTMSKSGVTEFSDWAIGNLAPTAAPVIVGGRVLTQHGRAISNAVVSLSDMNGETRYARTNAFGYYRFDGVTTGRTYILSVESKSYVFSPQVVVVTDELTSLDFIADP